MALKLKKILFFIEKSIGHINPVIPLIKQFAGLGYTVHVVCQNHGNSEKLITQVGAIFIPTFDNNKYDSAFLQEYLYENHLGGGLALISPLRSMIFFEELLLKVKTIDPDFIIYDNMCFEGYACTKVLQKPNAAFVTYAGLGCVVDDLQIFNLETSESLISEGKGVEKINHFFYSRYGCYMFDNNVLPLAYQSNFLNIYPHIEEMCQATTYGSFPFKILGHLEKKPYALYIGPTLDVENRVNGSHYGVGNTNGYNISDGLNNNENIDSTSNYYLTLHANLDFEDIKRRKFSMPGTKVIYVSFGTAITTTFWNDKNGFIDCIGGATSGKQFFQTLTCRIINCTKSMNNVILIINCGFQPDALDHDDFKNIPNDGKVYLRHATPQAKLLSLVDIFISHCGMGSVTEGILSSTPFIPLPGYGDQIYLAQMLKQNGIGYSDWDLKKSFFEATSEKLKVAIETINNNYARYINEVNKLRIKLENKCDLNGAVLAVEDVYIKYQREERVD
eukprot:Pgem_evm1s14925